MLLYLCPDLEQNLYLGIDFWRIFGLAPEIVGTDEITLANIEPDGGGPVIEYKLRPHILTEEQQNSLESVVKMFDTFEEKGLGMTTLEEHKI